MKKRPTIVMAHVLSAGLGLGLLVSANAVFAQDLQSLRGAKDVESTGAAPEVKQFLKDEKPINRDYLQQPPLIPHKIDNYRVNLKHNKCLSCHSWQNYREHNATKISQTHFENRDGAVLSNVSALRYFCTQCHVPQANAQPLVENTFEPVNVMKIR